MGFPDFILNIMHICEEDIYLCVSVRFVYFVTFRKSLCSSDPCGDSGACVEWYEDDVFLCICNQGYQQDDSIMADIDVLFTNITGGD